jgi:SAM-dependent methyltransferase
VPRRAHIARVDHSDPLPYYYLPIVGWLFRQRLQLALDLLGGGPYGKVLEAGYGSGILLPTLAARAKRIDAVDLHQRTDLVRRMLVREGVDATLAVGSVTGLGYRDASFDTVLCLSTLEHLAGDDLRAAVGELRRVTAQGGRAVVGIPSSGRLMDLLFGLIGFSEIDEHHVSTREDIEGALGAAFRIDGEARLPSVGPRDSALYTVLRCIAE